MTRFFARRLPGILCGLAVVFATAGAAAQLRPFNCIGAERLEDDAFAIPFAPRATAPGAPARANLAAVAALAKADPARNLCVLGHAGGQEGGAATSRDLAAKRARAVADALSKRGIERDRIRAEARTAAFARARTAAPEIRSVTVVLLPASTTP